MVTLRDYQLDAVDAVEEAWSKPDATPVVQLPTGTGKTVVIAELAARARRSGKRVLLAVNRDELVRQSVDKLAAASPGERIGVVQGAHDDWHHNLVVGSIQTISRENRLARIPDNHFDVIVADEMQYSGAPSWQRTFAHFPAARLVGFSATPIRNDKVGLGDTWSHVCFERDIAWAVEHQHLVKPMGHVTAVDGFTLEGVKTARTEHGNDYRDSEVAERLRLSHAPEAVAHAYLAVATDADGLPRRGIIFTPDVQSAHEFATAFNDAGICTQVVIGETPVAQRQAAYARVISGECRVLASVMVLSVGFDLPCVEVAVMARPTKSKALYIQQAGRVLRPSPATGKTGALIIDVCGVSTLGLACFADLRATRPTKETFGEERAPGLPKPKVDVSPIGEMIDLRPFDPITGKRVGESSSRVGGRDWATTWGDMPFLAPRNADEPLLFMSRTVQPTGELWAGWQATSYGKDRQPVAVGTYDQVKELLESIHKPLPLNWANQPATTNQRDYAASRGIVIAPEATKREASDAISLHIVSRAIDCTVPHHHRSA